MKHTSVRDPLVYVSDVSAGQVFVFRRDGVLQGSIAGFMDPAGLFVDSRHDLWVANIYGRNVLEFARGATSPIQTLNDPDGYPTDVTICPNGTVYVSNSATFSGGSGNIAVYAAGSTKPAGRLRFRDGYRFFFLTCDAAGNIFTTINTLSGVGTVVEYPGGHQSGARRLPINLSNFPGGIKQDNAGNLVIADANGGSISEYTEAGVPTGISILAPAQTAPEDIAITENGRALGVALFDPNQGGDAEGQSYTFPGGIATQSYGSFNKPIGFAFDPGQRGF